MEEFLAIKAETEKTLADYLRISEEFEALKGDLTKGNRTREISDITRERMSLTEQRIKAEEEAWAAGKIMKIKLVDITNKRNKRGY